MIHKKLALHLISRGPLFQFKFSFTIDARKTYAKITKLSPRSIR